MEDTIINAPNVVVALVLLAAAIPGVIVVAIASLPKGKFKITFRK